MQEKGKKLYKPRLVFASLRYLLCSCRLDWALFYRSRLEFFLGLYDSFGALVFNFVEIGKPNIPQKSCKLSILHCYFWIKMLNMKLSVLKHKWWVVSTEQAVALKINKSVLTQLRTSETIEDLENNIFLYERKNGRIFFNKTILGKKIWEMLSLPISTKLNTRAPNESYNPEKNSRRDL